MATLSTAMVAPMDGQGLLNASRVMASCRSDGVVLKPDVPLTTSDSCWRRADPTCLIYHTYSDVRGLGRAYYLYSDEHLTYNASLLPRGALVDVWHDWCPIRPPHSPFTNPRSPFQPRVALAAPCSPLQPRVAPCSPLQPLTAPYDAVQPRRTTSCAQSPCRYSGRIGTFSTLAEEAPSALVRARVRLN